jgi:hypothetical protein
MIVTGHGDLYLMDERQCTALKVIRRFGEACLHIEGGRMTHTELDDCFMAAYFVTCDKWICLYL